MLDNPTDVSSAPAPPVIDGSIDSAAQAIANISADRSDPVTPEAVTRGPDGKFTKAEQDPAKPEEKPAEEAPAEDDDDEIEWEEPDETEGAEPKKVRSKLSEVLEGYRKAKTLEGEIQKLKSESPPPVEWERETESTIQERSNYVDALQKWQAFNQIRSPDESLINPAHPNFNPELYWQQKTAADQLKKDHEQIAAEIDRVTGLNKKEADALLKSKALRERSKILEIWPELKEKANVDKTLAALKGQYGFDDQTLASVIDSRFYALAKDALAFRNGQTAKTEAVRKVLAKPKLVRAAARSSTDSKSVARTQAVDRLSRSGSLDDAAAALASLR